MHTLGRYRLLEEVGRGGMGAVYRAVDPDGQVVALKLLLAGQQASAPQRARFRREAEALARVRHEAVVALREAGEAPGPGSGPGTPFLALEWVAGETLARRLERQGPLAPDQALDLVLRLAEALEACHRAGVLHRDLKPHNVLVRERDGAPLLTDFGLTRELVPDQAWTVATRTGQWLGTPGWSPPELARGDRARMGPRSDVYGLGAVLFACLTGEPPQAGETLVELLAAAHQPPRSPRALVPEVPPALEALCLRCLDPEPSQRPESAAEVVAALRRARLDLRRRPGRAGARQLGLAAGALLVAGGALLAAWRLVAPDTAVASAAAPRPPAPDAAPDPAQEAPRLLREARAALRRNDLTLAMERVGAVLALGHPESASAAYLLRAQAQALSGSSSAAAEDARRALEGGSPAQQALARALLAGRTDQLAEALGQLDAAVELGPDAEVAFWRGTTRQRARDLAGAIDDYTRALELEPDHVLALHNRGSARIDSGDLAGGIEDLERAVALDPRDAKGHLTLGQARQARGDLPGALADVVRAQELDPRDAGAWSTGGLIRLQQGDPARAAADLSRALELEPRDVNAWHHRGLARLDLGDLAGAIADYTRALELDPRRPETLANRGSARQLSGDVPGAIADFEQALRLFPSGSPQSAQVRQILAGLR